MRSRHVLLVAVVLFSLAGCRVTPSPGPAGVPLPPAVETAAPTPARPTALPDPSPTATPRPAPPSPAAAPLPPALSPSPAAAASPGPGAGVDAARWTIGYSVHGRPLDAYRFGTGPVRVAVVGGIHGGYEGNTVLLVEQMVRHLQQHPEDVPSGATLYIIPNANPDGYARGAIDDGRFNGNGVDLNRNWDYDWQQYNDWWGGQTLYGGAHPFSEPETRALRDLILGEGIAAAVFYHSMGGFITYPRSADASARLAECFAAATGYDLGGAGSFGYTITGDSSRYLREQGVATIDIELTDHEYPEWERNRAGLLEGLSCWLKPVPAGSTFHVHD